VTRWLLPALLTCACHGRDDCATGDAVDRENCRFEKASALFSAGDDAWRAQLEGLPGAHSRDLLRLRLAVLDPQQGPALCRQMETPAAQDRCRQVAGRPHLASPPRPGEGDAQ
jgi:hypothetical protein